MSPDDGPDAEAPARLRWPEGLDEATFLARHWQRAPLLLRGALPGFETPLPPDELAGLSLEPDTTPRLIRRDAGGAFTLEHGPFEETIFAGLGERDWSLLVTDVDKHVPELAAWLAPFRLAPDWRLDDLMVSYAPDGASVGAHVDEYDVFLLQASGTRRWSIDASAGEAPGSHRSVAHGDLRLLADFTPSDTWDLEPGDVLYLPPGVPHHGVAVGEDCTTWSIGFRAPSAADVVLHLAERVAERLAARLPQTRLADAGRGRGEPGRIDAATIDAVAALWREATTLDRETLEALTGELLTRSGTAADDGAPEEERDDDGESGDDGDVLRYRVAPFARLAWSGEGERVALFANGERLESSGRLARLLCAADGDVVRLDPDATGADERATCAALVERGVLLPGS